MLDFFFAIPLRKYKILNLLEFVFFNKLSKVQFGVSTASNIRFAIGLIDILAKDKRYRKKFHKVSQNQAKLKDLE
jgi:hypothetical protein